ncbi:MAG: helicase HerA domain-containing protein [Pseudonocardia sp.]
MADLIPNIGAGTLLEHELLGSDRAVRIGAVQRLDYHEAVVLTHDRWKFEAGGIPQFTFLLATAHDVGSGGTDDDEVLLLRVEGTAPLTLESDLHAVREEALRDALSQHEDSSPQVVLDLDLDPFTRNRASFTGLRCRVLGTFYEDDVDGMKRLEFGADVDNFYATSTYRVLKPVGAGLAAIASYLKPSPSPQPVHRVAIGHVRYSATRRRAIAAKQSASTVEVNIHDFIGHKTGLLGMTRTGKSNTAKILVARTFIVSEQRRAAGEGPIGQLIFDPQGEYANDNVQDGSAIAAIGQRHVRIFRFGADARRPHVRPLGINFYDPQQIEAVQGLIADQLRADGNSGYVRDFGVAEFTDVEGDYGKTARRSRGRLLLYAALLRAGFEPPTTMPSTGYRYHVAFSIAKELRESLISELGRDPFKAVGRNHGILTDDLYEVVDAILKLRDADNAEALKFCDDPVWAAAEPIYTARSTSGGSRTVRGWRNLLDLKAFHDPNTQRDVADEIYECLLEGRIVIVDLHIGTQAVITSLSEQITRHLLKRQTSTFTSDATPPAIQVLLEEAHNLFSTVRYRDDADVWVKLAKEAAKLRIGMLYATQEVSGVAHQLLRTKKVHVNRLDQSLLELLFLLHGAPGRPADTVPVNCTNTDCPERDVPVPDAGSACPGCGTDLLPTDTLRLHEAVSEEGSNEEALGRLRSVVELLVLVGLATLLWQQSRDDLLATTLFVLDGPLAMYGEPAKLRGRAQTYFQAMTASVPGLGPFLCGIEKSGAMVDYARQLARHDVIAPGDLLICDAEVIARVAGAADPARYGKETYWGRKFIYRSLDGRVVVPTVMPATGAPYASSGGQPGPDGYPTLPAILDVIDRTGSSMYRDGIIPVAAAHGRAAFPIGVGTDVLRLVAKRKLGLGKAR